MRRSTDLLVSLGFVITAAFTQRASAQPDERARAAIDTAIARMGGRAALDSLRTVQYEFMTQWLSLTPELTQFGDAPTYERQLEWRDYHSRIWRNKRQFPSAAQGWQEFTDLVVDSIPARRLGPGQNATLGIPNASLPIDGWAALKVAYVDERRELFAWAPERVLLELSNAPDLRSRPDTVISGHRHSTVSATIDGFPFTAFLRRSTGLPSVVRFVANEANDFGLAPWGRMEIEIWYSRWARNASAGAILPRQWDTRRAGRLYKRMSVLAAAFNTPMPADSVSLPDSVTKLYLAAGRRPMGDREMDSAKVVVSGRVVAFYGIGVPGGAVRVGDGWFLLDRGNLPVNAERASLWLAANKPEGAARMLGAIVTANQPGSAAVVAARAGNPVYVAPSGSAILHQALRASSVPAATVSAITVGRWLRSSGSQKDSVWIEPIDLTNGSGLVVYAPSARWAFSGAASGPLDISLIARAIRRRGWVVDRVGTAGQQAGVTPPAS